LPTGVAASFRKTDDPANAQCPGSAADPKAARGNLCLYEAVALDVKYDETGFVDPVTTLSTDTTRPYGVVFRALPFFVNSPFYLYGTWAVTAP
jgi:hypothetical protein